MVMNSVSQLRAVVRLDVKTAIPQTTLPAVWHNGEGLRLGVDGKGSTPVVHIDALIHCVLKSINEPLA